MRWPRRTTLALTVLALCVIGPAAALAHVERSSYWPDPAPDCSIKPCTGGQVPTVRTLASALNRKAVGDTRVVCQPDSLKLLTSSIARARANGYDVRPTDHRSLSRSQARTLLDLNRKLFARCGYSEIQPAVTASGNNDRVVIMPGLYTEPTSRAQPTHDPKCADLTEQNDRQTDTGDNQSGALSYPYQVKCPNDQNLVAVIGRAV